MVYDSEESATPGKPVTPKCSKSTSQFLGNNLDIMFKYPPRSAMRVVAGKAKGRRLRGASSPAVRPTTERVRAAIFNILQAQLYQEGRVLDLYAGTGSLGIEALSRGAQRADFVEQDRRQCAVIEANLDNTGFREWATVRCSAVEPMLTQLDGPYRLVLLDPPYRLQNLGEVLDTIASIPNLVDTGGMVVAGHSKRLQLQSAYGSLQLISQRRYGDNAVDFFCNTFLNEVEES
jgi:16S rRNA (guanine966-N2)-methyltransferase